MGEESNPARRQARVCRLRSLLPLPRAAASHRSDSIIDRSVQMTRNDLCAYTHQRAYYYHAKRFATRMRIECLSHPAGSERRFGSDRTECLSSLLLAFSFDECQGFRPSESKEGASFMGIYEATQRYVHYTACRDYNLHSR